MPQPLKEGEFMDFPFSREWQKFVILNEVKNLKKDVPHLTGVFPFSREW
jgi:hypothetical protein